MPPALGDIDKPLLATAVVDGPIIIPEEEPLLAEGLQMELLGESARLAPAGAPVSAPTSAPAAAPTPPAAAGPHNPFAWEEAGQPQPAPSAPAEPHAGAGGAAAGAPSPSPSPMPLPPWQQEAAALQAALEQLQQSPEEIERADALGAANDCREFGWSVQRLPYSAALPLLPRDLAGAQLEARRARKKR